MQRQREIKKGKRRLGSVAVVEVEEEAMVVDGHEKGPRGWRWR
jgi:hypothetical protein